MKQPSIQYTTLAAIARQADAPPSKVRSALKAKGIEPDATTKAGRARLWLFSQTSALEIVNSLTKVL